MREIQPIQLAQVFDLPAGLRQPGELGERVTNRCFEVLLDIAHPALTLGMDARRLKGQDPECQVVEQQKVERAELPIDMHADRCQMQRFVRVDAPALRGGVKANRGAEVAQAQVDLSVVGSCGQNHAIEQRDRQLLNRLDDGCCIAHSWLLGALMCAAKYSTSGANCEPAHAMMTAPGAEDAPDDVIIALVGAAHAPARPQHDRTTQSCEQLKNSWQ